MYKPPKLGKTFFSTLKVLLFSLYPFCKEVFISLIHGASCVLVELIILEKKGMNLKMIAFISSHSSHLH